MEKTIPHDHLLSTLGKPRDAKRRSSGRIFLSYPHTYDRFFYPAVLPTLENPISHTPYQPMGRIKNETATRGKKSNVIVILKYSHHSMSYLSVFTNFEILL